jgi:PAS domain S-box-containing protein
MPSRPEFLRIKPHVAALAGGLSLALALAGLQALDGFEAWKRAQRDAERSVANLSLVAEQEVAGTLRTIDISLKSVAELIELSPSRRLDDPAVGAAMKERLKDLPFARSIAIFDSEGQTVQNTGGIPVTTAISAADREYFAAHRLVLGAPIVGRTTQQLAIPMSRRISGPDGKFGGVVAAFVDPRAMAGVYGDVDVGAGGAGGAIAVIRADGTMLSRFPYRAEFIGRNIGNTPLFREHLSRSRAGVATGAQALDGVARLYGYRTLADFPVVVFVGIEQDRIWRETLPSILLDFGGAAAFMAVIGLATILLARAMRRQEALLVERSNNEQRFRDLTEVASDWFWETDADLRFNFFSPRRQEVMGESSDPLMGRTQLELLEECKKENPGADWSSVLKAWETHQPFRNLGYWRRAADGSRRFINISGTPAYDRSGKFLGFRGTASDLTAQMRAEEDARAARDRLIDAIDSLPDAFGLFDKDDKLVLLNEAFKQPAGSPQTPGVTSYRDVISAVATRVALPDSLGDTPEAWVAERMRRHLSHSKTSIEVHYKNGRWGHVIESRTRDGGATLLRIDITELKQRQRAAEQLAAQQRAVAELSHLALQTPDPIELCQSAVEFIAKALSVELASTLELEPDGQNLILRTAVGWKAGSIGAKIPTGSSSLAGLTLAADKPLVLEDIDRETRFTPSAMLREHKVRSGMTVVIPGHPRPFGTLGAYSKELRGFTSDEIGFMQAVAYVLSTAIAHRQAYQERLAREMEMDLILNTSVDGIIVTNSDGKIVRFSVGAEKIFGYRAEEVLGRRLDMLLPERFHARHAGHMRAFATDARQSRMMGATDAPIFGRRKDGTEFPAETTIAKFDVGGRLFFTANLRDITIRLRQEEMLRQAQKMEAVGQLTGGIAHDFNNLLTVILGSAETLTEALAADPKLKRVAEMAGSAARRAADLTRNLLAFSRRQKLEAKVTDINDLLSRLEGLLRRSLGEHVAIELARGAGLWTVAADPAQLESAILNLGLNARDAMPGGGTLTIETANVELDADYARQNQGAAPGPYVMIAVSDTGEGMTPEVAAKAFDPFFTTKEVDKGTGLGLSMVHGFVKQSNGHVKLYSEVGHGTTVKLYLPRSSRAETPSVVPGDPTEARGGGETILMVEDNDLVRAHVESMLKSLGYRVLSAGNGPEALEILRQDQAVDLLFTDVIMPGGMTGLQLADAARRLRPALKVLYTSGYAESAIGNHGRLGEAVDLLSKPYQQRDLAAKLRKVIEAKRPAS